MSILLKGATVVDFTSPYHKKKTDILIEKGRITSLVGGDAKRVIDLEGKYVSCGWFDLNAQFSDPGYEHREDIESGSLVAMYGGFTDVVITPNTKPVIQSKADITYILKRAKEVNLHVVASISEEGKGENLTEIFDLYDAGAVAFSSGDDSVWNAKLLLKALQYTSQIGTPVIQNARDIHLSENTHMHEGLVSTNLGLRAEPSLSEELIIKRDLEILKYSGGRLHFSRLSTKGGLELIRKAKKEGLNISCDVGIHHLLFTDKDVSDFDTNFKSLPPYRTEADRKALIKGLKDGTIDAICSNHRPYDQESKELEFDLADPGNISLQTFTHCLAKLSKELTLDALIDKITNGPRKLLKKPEFSITEEAEACLTIFDVEEKWTLNSNSNKSKSENSPFWEKELHGKVIGIFNKGELHLTK